MELLEGFAVDPAVWNVPCQDEFLTGLTGPADYLLDNQSPMRA